MRAMPAGPLATAVALTATAAVTAGLLILAGAGRDHLRDVADQLVREILDTGFACPYTRPGATVERVDLTIQFGDPLTLKYNESSTSLHWDAKYWDGLTPQDKQLFGALVGNGLVDHCTADLATLAPLSPNP